MVSAFANVPIGDYVVKEDGQTVAEWYVTAILIILTPLIFFYAFTALIIYFPSLKIIVFFVVILV